METFTAWGASLVGLVGDGINSIIEALRKRQDQTRYVGIRHEEAAASWPRAGPEHAVIVANRACRAALGDRGVAHLAVSKDVQMMRRSADKRSERNPAPEARARGRPRSPPRRSSNCRRLPKSSTVGPGSPSSPVKALALGNPEFGCTLAPIDVIAFAKACAGDGFRCDQPSEIRPAIQAALKSPRAALVEAVVDAEEKPAKPGELTV